MAIHYHSGDRRHDSHSHSTDMCRATPLRDPAITSSGNFCLTRSPPTHTHRRASLPIAGAIARPQQDTRGHDNACQERIDSTQSPTLLLLFNEVLTLGRPRYEHYHFRKTPRSLRLPSASSVMHT